MKSMRQQVFSKSCCFSILILFGICCPASLTDAVPETRAPNTCPVSKTVMTEPERVAGAGRFGYSAWYVNEDRTIWVRNDSWRAGPSGNKVLWKKPIGTILRVSGKRLDGPAAPTHTGYTDSKYGFAVTGLYFESPGCWAMTADAGTERLEFVTEVLPALRGR
jgi:hypothetical protein